MGPLSELQTVINANSERKLWYNKETMKATNVWGGERKMKEKKRKQRIKKKS